MRQHNAWFALRIENLLVKGAVESSINTKAETSTLLVYGKKNRDEETPLSLCVLR